MSMLKCGQKDNCNYTFGSKKEEDENLEIINSNKICKNCKAVCSLNEKVCSACGEKI